MPFHWMSRCVEKVVLVHHPGIFRKRVRQILSLYDIHIEDLFIGPVNVNGALIYDEGIEHIPTPVESRGFQGAEPPN